MCGGDGKIFNGVSTYKQALEKVQQLKNTNVIFFWHSPSQRLIEKPAGKGAFWKCNEYEGFMFAWGEKVHKLLQ